MNANPGKPCGWCGKPMYPKPREGIGRFSVRECCSLRCSGFLRASRERKPPAEMTARYRRTKVNGHEISEHRAVAEKALGRKLRSNEEVHHINEDRFDNRLENLEVVTKREHADRHTYLPTTKFCVICRHQYTPHKTKRRRAQTCGKPICVNKLRSIRAYERP